MKNTEKELTAEELLQQAAKQFRKQAASLCRTSIGAARAQLEYLKQNQKGAPIAAATAIQIMETEIYEFETASHLKATGKTATPAK